MNTCYRCLIIEDEGDQANYLSLLLKRTHYAFDIYKAPTVQDAKLQIQAAAFDMIFLDLHLKESSGLQLGEWIRQQNAYAQVPIIIVTADDSQAMNAVNRMHCAGYLTKPYFLETLYQVLKSIFDTFFQTTKAHESLTLSYKGFEVKLNQDEIRFIESQNRKLFICTSDKKVAYKTYPLKKIMTNLNENFVQVHRGFVINVQFIHIIDKTGLWISLTGCDEKIPIGRHYKANVIRYLHQDFE